MASYSKELISGGSANSRPIKVVAAATPGTLIHTGPTAPVKDELFLWCSNFDTADRTLTLEWGGVTSPDDLLLFTCPARDTILVAGGLIITGGLLVRAFGSVANMLVINGYANRIS